MKHLICILILLLFQLKAAEITYTVKETTSLLPQKNISRSKSNYPEQELQKSFSYYLIMKLPHEVGFKIAEKLFDFNDKSIALLKEKGINASILLRYFYKNRLYNSLELDPVIGKYINLDQNSFFLMSDRKLDHLLNAVEEIKREYRFCGHLYNLGLTNNFVMSERVYQILERAAQGVNLIVDSRKKKLCSNHFSTGLGTGMPEGFILGGLVSVPFVFAFPLQLCGISPQMGLLYSYGFACGGCACLGGSCCIAATLNGGLREIISIKPLKQD